MIFFVLKLFGSFKKEETEEEKLDFEELDRINLVYDIWLFFVIFLKSFKFQFF